LVSYKSKKQSIVARSTTKTEYRAMTLGVVEMLWLKGLLTYLKLDKETQIKLWCDNQSSISIANYPVQHDKTKHVEID
jgi:hypothetical protein